MERLLRYSWILPDRLAVGATPSTLKDLHRHGFQAVLNLQELDEFGPDDEPPGDMTVERVEIRDGLVGGVPSQEQIRTAVEVLERFQGSGLKTYVHCLAGVGRSPTICMAYVARAEGLEAVEAVLRVTEAHPGAAPTEDQLAALHQFLTESRQSRSGKPGETS